MKRTFVCALLLLLLAGCQSSHTQFCQNASTKLCDMCHSCGNDYAPCGMVRSTSREECISVVSDVCLSNDRLYTRDVVANCLSGLDRLTCEQLRSEGKPEACARIF